MARTPLGRWLEAAASAAQDEHDTRLTRGQLLKRAGLAGAMVAGAGALGRFAPPAEGAGGPSIAVVGAGLAGLSAAGYRWTKGSYSYWKVGQYTAFAGMERARQGNCHFAGEHTSIDFQGYLNGAVESGQRAAGEILADLK